MIWLLLVYMLTDNGRQLSAAIEYHSHAACDREVDRLQARQDRLNHGGPRIFSAACEEKDDPQ